MSDLIVDFMRRGNRAAHLGANQSPQAPPQAVNLRFERCQRNPSVSAAVS
jgi:hypothetical protein